MSHWNGSQSPQMAKRTQGLILFAHVMLLFLLFVFVAAPGLSRPASQSSGFPVMAAIAGAILLGSVFYAQRELFVRFVTGDQSELATPAQYQTKLLIGLSLAEFAYLLGLFIVLPTERLLAFVLMGGSFAVMVFVILPAWMSYWNARKARGLDNP